MDIDVPKLRKRREELLQQVMELENLIASCSTKFKVGDVVKKGAELYAITDIIYESSGMGYRLAGSKLTKTGKPSKTTRDLGNPQNLTPTKLSI